MKSLASGKIDSPRRQETTTLIDPVFLSRTRELGSLYPTQSTDGRIHIGLFREYQKMVVPPGWKVVSILDRVHHRDIPRRGSFCSQMNEGYVSFLALRAGFLFLVLSLFSDELDWEGFSAGKISDCGYWGRGCWRGLDIYAECFRVISLYWLNGEVIIWLGWDCGLRICIWNVLWKYFWGFFGDITSVQIFWYLFLRNRKFTELLLR